MNQSHQMIGYTLSVDWKRWKRIYVFLLRHLDIDVLGSSHNNVYGVHVFVLLFRNNQVIGNEKAHANTDAKKATGKMVDATT